MNRISCFACTHWPFVVGLLAGFYFLGLPVTGRDFAYFPGDFGDARFNMYLVEHATLFFRGWVKDYWDAPFMYPEPHVIAYADNLLGASPFYGLFRMLGLDRHTSFQCWFHLLSALNFTACYLFLFYWTRNAKAAVLGALVFAYSIALQSQMSHIQTFSRFPIPLAFWMSMLFMRRYQPVYFALALGFVVYEFYCGMYLGLLLIIPMTILYLWMIIKYRRVLLEKAHSKNWMKQMVLALLINVLMLYPLLNIYARQMDLASLPSHETILSTVPTITSHFFAHSGSIWKVLTEFGVDREEAWWHHQIFAGGIATMCILVMIIVVLVRKWRCTWLTDDANDPLLLMVFGSGILMMVLFVKIRSASLYMYLSRLDGFASIRQVARIINVELLFFAIATSFVLRPLFRRYSKWSGLIFIGCLGLLVLDNSYRSEQSYRQSKIKSQEAIAYVEQKLKDLPPGALFSYEPTDTGTVKVFYHIDAMLAAQTYGLKTVNGYSGYFPYGYGDYWKNMNEESRKYWFYVKEFAPNKIYILK
ncbi:MAG: hypothetical protein KDD36_05340 [Flavobacteriales bacterium]|nr:hypothetical protein [Flavobacteriales bacterium]